MRVPSPYKRIQFVTIQTYLYCIHSMICFKSISCALQIIPLILVQSWATNMHLQNFCHAASPNSSLKRIRRIVIQYQLNKLKIPLLNLSLLPSTLVLSTSVVEGVELELRLSTRGVLEPEVPLSESTTLFSFFCCSNFSAFAVSASVL
jgi:hypothetical protein